MAEFNQIEMVLDMRENGLEQELNKSKNIRFRVKQLDLGDIVFMRGEETLLIIERKTVEDLKASICDGRSREQKARLLGTGIPTERIMYIIEGNLDRELNSKVSGVPVSTLVGSIINTELRDNIKVYKTASLHETALYLEKMLDKLNKDGNDYFKSEEKKISASEYSASLKKKKKANMTPTVWFINTLSSIPQVTEKIADVVVARYGSMSKLMEEYERTPEHLRVKLLSDMKYVIANDKERRIGDIISKRIYNFICGILDE